MKNIKKVWGDTSLIFDNGSVHVYVANISKNKSCSKHCHEHKNNIFYLQSGLLKVLIWEEDTAPIEHILQAGDSIDIKCGLKHQFFSLEDSILVEIYYTTLNHEDIIRYI